MAYNIKVADRLRKMFKGREEISEKAMFGGINFLIDGRMFAGVLQDNLVVRVNPVDTEEFLKKPFVKPMDFSGKPMIGFLYVSRGGYKTDKQLKEWIDISLQFAASIPEKKKK